MRISIRSALALLSFIAATAPTPAAWSQQNTAAAEALFNRGIADMDAGKYRSACPALAESYRLDPLPGVLFALADCYAKDGKVATALARYEDYLRLLPQLTPAQQQKQRTAGREQAAMDAKAQLGPEVPLLTLVLPATAPKGTRVVQDEQELGAASLGIALPIDPGEHVVTTQAPGRSAQEQRFTIQKGEKKTVELSVGSLIPTDTGPLGGGAQDTRPPPPPPSADSGGEMSGQRIGAIAAGGVGVAGLLVGGITGALVLGKKSTVEAGCTEVPGGGGQAACRDQSSLDAAESAQTLGLVSTIGFGVGIAGLAAGAVLFFTESESEAQSSGARRWIRVEVAGARGGGAMAGVRGVW